MPSLKLTEPAVKKIKPPKTGQVDYFDQLLPSFGLRVSYSGTKAWFAMTRVNGKLIRVTIGRYPAIKLKQAREKASEAMQLAHGGIDPRQVEKEKQRKQIAQARNSFSYVADQFWTNHVELNLKPTTAAEYKRILFGPDVKAWQNRPVASITKQDVLDVIDGIRKRAPGGSADNALAYLRKFFNWCVDREIIDLSPAQRIKRMQPVQTRERVLSEDEIRTVWRAIELEPGLFGPMFKLLLLTGQRLREVAGMRYGELKDLETSNAIWTIPGSRTKNGRGHLVPLSPATVKVIRSVPKTSPLLFSTNGVNPASGFSRAKRRLNKNIDLLAANDGLPPVKDWRLHDLRRTMVTMMNEKLRIAPHVVEACINHISGSAKAGVAGVYNRALYLDERREGLNAWSELISNLAGFNRISV